MYGPPLPSKGRVGDHDSSRVNVSKWQYSYLGTLLGIHKALRYMFTTPEQGYAWVRKSNAAFGGQSALQKMMQGAPTDLAQVRDYLDAERGGW